MNILRTGLLAGALTLLVSGAIAQTSVSTAAPAPSKPGSAASKDSSAANAAPASTTKTMHKHSHVRHNGDNTISIKPGETAPPPAPN